MPSLSYVNVFAQDVVALSGFYQRVFGFPEIEAIRTDADGRAVGTVPFNAG